MLNSKVGWGLVLFGMLVLLGLRILNDRDDWILAVMEIPVASSESRSMAFAAPSDGNVEIQLDVDESVAKDLLDTYIFPAGSPSALDVRWQVSNNGRGIAAGDARDYLYLENRRSLLGRLRRIVMQDPFGRDQTHWNSLGILGSRTVARGIGRFPTKTGETYTVTVVAHDDSNDLGRLSPLLLVRAERRSWQIHYEKVRGLGYLGLALIAAGLTVTVVGRLPRKLLSRRH